MTKRLLAGMVAAAGLTISMAQQVVRETVTVDPMTLGSGDSVRGSSQASVNSIVMGCGNVERSLCANRCEDDAAFQGGRVILSSCVGWNERLALVCNCTISIPPPGPFLPPCYWNCRTSSVGGLVGNVTGE